MQFYVPHQMQGDMRTPVTHTHKPMQSVHGVMLVRKQYDQRSDSQEEQERDEAVIRVRHLDPSSSESEFVGVNSSLNYERPFLNRSPTLLF